MTRHHREGQGSPPDLPRRERVGPRGAGGLQKGAAAPRKTTASSTAAYRGRSPTDPPRHPGYLLQRAAPLSPTTPPSPAPRPAWLKGAHSHTTAAAAGTATTLRSSGTTWPPKSHSPHAHRPGRPRSAPLITAPSHLRRHTLHLLQPHKHPVPPVPWPRPLLNRLQVLRNTCVPGARSLLPAPPLPTCRVPPGAARAAKQQPEVQRDPDRTGEQQHQPVSHWPPRQPAPSPLRRILPAAPGRPGRPQLLPAPPPLGQPGRLCPAAAGSCSPSPAPAGSGGAGGGSSGLQPPQCRGAARPRPAAARAAGAAGHGGGCSARGAERACSGGGGESRGRFTSRFTRRGSAGVSGECPRAVAARYPTFCAPPGEPRGVRKGAG